MREGLELGPHDAGMDPAIEWPLGKAAISPCYQIFAPHQPCKTHDALRDQSRMLDHIRGVTDDARDQRAARWQLGGFPDTPFVLVARIGDFDSADLHAQDDIDNILERHVAGVRGPGQLPQQT